MRSNRIPVKDGEFLNRANALTLYAIGRAVVREISTERASEGGAMRKFRCG